MKRRNLAIGLALLTACYLTQFTVATATRKAEPTKFTVRVENISNPEGMTASDGQKFPFALSPGMFVLTDKSAALFTEGKSARKNGLEMQAEDGDPSGLVDSLVAMHHSSNLHGVFNTPVGAMAAGPIRPGDSYEFTVTAAPGMRLFMTQMFGQSNDWFYAPGANGIALFEKGVAISGDITNQFYLWDAGTEKDEEIGIGPNQGPRQKGLNTGEAENGVVHRVKDERWTGKNTEYFRITITPEGGM
jgi:hypothetical protein